MTLSRSRWLMLPVTILGLIFFVACGSDDDEADSTGARSTGAAGEERAVEQTIRDTVEAYQSGDTERFLSHWTDEGLQNEFGASADEIRAAGPEFFAGPPIELGNFKDIEVDGDSATAEFDFIFGAVLQPQRYVLVQEATAWKIDVTASLDAEIPRNASRVEVDMDEFAFEFDASNVKTNVAFALDNTGDQPHEAVLLQVPPGMTIEQLLQADPAELPPGVQIVGFAGPFEADDDGTMVFTQSLPAGTYMFVCFIPDTTDPEEAPHAAKGMATTFEIKP